MRTIDLLTATLKEEFNDFVDNFKSKKDDSKIDLVNDKGDIIIPSMVKSEIFEKIEDTIDNKFNSYVEDNYIYVNDYYRAISDKVKILRNVDSQKGLNFALKTLVQKANDSSFAGMLLINRDTGFIFNPAHPLNISLIKKGKVNLPDKFDIFIFNFKQDLNKEEIEKTVEEAYKMHLIYANLFLKKRIENLEYKITVEDSQTDFDKIFFISDTKSSIRIYKDISKNFNTILFPLQVLSKGELVPYIGWGGITKEIKSMSLYGNASGNLKAYYYSSNLNVCTGDKNNQSLEGWYTLSKINVNSTWFLNYVNKYFQEITFAAHKLAVDILLGKLPEEFSHL